MVAFLPQCKNDDEITEITAFNSRGNTLKIPVDHAEDYCYIIVGPNERTNKNEELLSDLIFIKSMQKAPDDIFFESNQLSKMLGTGATRPDNWRLRFYRLGIYDDHEPYALRGDPEISVKFSSKAGIVGTYNFDGRFDYGYSLGDWIYFGYTVCYWRESIYGPVIGFLVYERDGGGKYEISNAISVKNSSGVTESVTIKFTISDLDDTLYQGTIAWHDPYPHEYRNTDARLMINSIQ